MSSAAAEPPPPTTKRPTRGFRYAPLRTGWQPLWRRLWIRMRRRRPKPAAYSMLPVLMEVFAGFSKLDGEVMEEEIDSSLGFMRYDYPEAVYSELRRVYLEALQKPQDLNARARELGRSLSMEQKILLGVQLYLLISRSANARQQLVEFYLFMTNLGIASQAIDIVYQLNSEERPPDDEFRAASGQPLETLRIASRDPHDVLLRSLSAQCHVTSFRYQNLVLLKNTGTVPVLVRSRTLRPGDFSRLYPGERVVLEDASLDYTDFISYFNAKKNLTGTQLYLTLTDEGSAEISQARGRGTNLRVSFGLGVTIEALRDTNARINGRRLRAGTKVEASIEDKLIVEREVEISLEELRRRAREFGEQFRLEGSRNIYLVSNNPDLLSAGDILLTNEGEGEVLLKITCDYAAKTGELEVLRTDRPIFVGAAMVKEKAQLTDGDTITLGEGQFLRCHFADRIIEEERNVIRIVELREVSHRFGSQRDTALEGISLTARRGEMICVMGPSGCGKSTLLRLLAGQLKPAHGEVMMNGFGLYGQSAQLRPYIAYIPQEDAFDPLLRVQENLDYSVAVRCPHFSKAERRKRVDAKLVELGLNEMRLRLAGTPQQKYLSGGERKRLNAGLDMIGIADVYLFDEPTSGLSSKDSEHVLELIRSLAHNKIVFASIHQPSMRLLGMFDKALLLDKGGKMAFFGTPQAMLEYFWEAYREETGQRDESPQMPDKITPDFVFDVLETPLRDISGDMIQEQTPDGHLLPARRFPPNFWRDRFQTHVLLRSVAHQMETKRDDSRVDNLAPQRKAPTPPRLNYRDESVLFVTMLKRAFLSKLRNRANLLTTLLEAPALAFLISMVLRYSEEENYTFASAFHIPTYLFLSLVVAMFLGLTNSADEIIRDRHMLNRERNHNLRVTYYIFGKVAALAAFALMQCVIYLLIGNAILEIREMFLIHLVWMFLTALTGACLGLLVSSLVHDSRTALNVIPLILIPQIILGGALIKYEEMNRNLDFVYSIRRWMDQKGSDDASAASKLKVPFICQFMPLRWSYESAIISQAKMNPLTRSQDLLEARIQSLIPPPGGQMSPEHRRQLDAAKQALAVVSGLQDADAESVARRLAAIKRGIGSENFDISLLEQPKGRRGISAEGIFVNRKVLDLVTKAEMEREDYRRKTSTNVFFGTERTYPLFGANEGGAKNEKSVLQRPPARPWYQEIRVNTLTLNAAVMIFTLVIIIGGLEFSLRRQLSRV